MSRNGPLLRATLVLTRNGCTTITLFEPIRRAALWHNNCQITETGWAIWLVSCSRSRTRKRLGFSHYFRFKQRPSCTCDCGPRRGSFGRRVFERSPDGELRIEIQENLRACDIFQVQPTGPPLDQNLMELFFLADARRPSEANPITASYLSRAC